MYFFNGEDGMVKLKEFVENKAQYCHTMRQFGEWADHTVVLATAKYLRENHYVSLYLKVDIKLFSTDNMNGFI